MNTSTIVTINKTWQSVETLMGETFDADKKYQIQARGAYGVIYLTEATEPPSSSDWAGQIIPADGFLQAEYKKKNGYNLYAKVNGTDTAVINICDITED